VYVYAQFILCENERVSLKINLKARSKERKKKRIKKINDGKTRIFTTRWRFEVMQSFHREKSEKQKQKQCGGKLKTRENLFCHFRH